MTNKYIKNVKDKAAFLETAKSMGVDEIMLENLSKMIDEGAEVDASFTLSVYHPLTQTIDMYQAMGAPLEKVVDGFINLLINMAVYVTYKARDPGVVGEEATRRFTNHLIFEFAKGINENIAYNEEVRDAESETKTTH